MPRSSIGTKNIPPEAERSYGEIAEYFFAANYLSATLPQIQHGVRDTSFRRSKKNTDTTATFFLSKADSAYKVENHRIAVALAFEFTKTTISVVSQRSVLSNWTKLESLWAVEQNHPIIVCLLDDADPRLLHRHLLRRRWFKFRQRPRAVVDFSQDAAAGVTKLMRVLEQPEFAPDFDRMALVEHLSRTRT